MRLDRAPSPRLIAARTELAPARVPWWRRIHEATTRAVVVGLFLMALVGSMVSAVGTSDTASASVGAVPGIDTCTFVDAGNSGWDPESPGQGGGGFMYPSNHTAPGKAKTPLEKYGLRGLTWSMTAYSPDVSKVDSDDDMSCSLTAPIQNMAAQTMLSFSKTITSVTITVRQKATDASPFMDMYRDAAPDAGTTFKRWVLPGAGVMVVAAGLWILINSAASSTRKVISGFAWVLIALFATLYLNAPTHMATGRDGAACDGLSANQCDIALSGGTDDGSTTILSSDSNAFAWTAKANDTGNDVSNLFLNLFTPEASSDVCSAGDVEDSGARTLDCALWYEMAFRPWAVGQFGGIGSNPIDWTAPKNRDPKPPDAVIDGMSGTAGAKGSSAKYAKAEKPKVGDDVRLIMLRAQAFSWQEAQVTGMPRNVNGTIAPPIGGEYTGAPNRVSTIGSGAAQPSTFQGKGTSSRAEDATDGEDYEAWDVTTKNGLWNQVRAYMAGEQPATYSTWAGQAHVGDRVSVGFQTLFGDILVAAFVIFTSLLTLMWYAVVIIALLFLAVISVLAIYPPGQKFLKGALQLWAKGLILAVVFLFAQTAVGGLTGAVMGSNASFGWKAILLLAAIMALFKVVKLAREDAFTPNFNSEGVAEGADPQNGANRVSPFVTGAAFTAGRMAMRGPTTLAGTAARKAGGRALGRTGESKEKSQQRTGKQQQRTEGTAGDEAAQRKKNPTGSNSPEGPDTAGTPSRTGRKQAAPRPTGKAGKAREEGLRNDSVDGDDAPPTLWWSWRGRKREEQRQRNAVPEGTEAHSDEAPDRRTGKRRERSKDTSTPERDGVSVDRTGRQQRQEPSDEPQPRGKRRERSKDTSTPERDGVSVDRTGRQQRQEPSDDEPQPRRKRPVRPTPEREQTSVNRTGKHDGGGLTTAEETRLANRVREGVSKDMRDREENPIPSVPPRRR